jgi:hypothetical protein
METNVSLWRSGGGLASQTLTRDTTRASVGLASAKKTSANSTAASETASFVYGLPNPSDGVAAAPGDTFACRVDCFNAGTNPQMRLSVRWYNASNTLLGGSGVIDSTTLIGQWVTLDGVTPAAPANTAWANLELGNFSSASGQTTEIYMDAVLMLRGSTVPSSYFDGSIDGCLWLGTAHASASASGAYATDAYSDGAAATFGALTAGPRPALFATYITPALMPVPLEEDAYFARRGFPSAQQQIGSTGPERGTRQRAVCGWHGTWVDEEPQGASFAIVQRDGDLADLVGERVKVSLGDRHIYAYVHRDADLDSGDEISLSRRLFIGLAPLATESLDVRVETLGAST